MRNHPHDTIIKDRGHFVVPQIPVSFGGVIMSAKKIYHHKKRSVQSDRLAKERIRKGLTQEQLAEAASTSLGLVRKYEQGERNPSSGYIKDMADYFECAPEYLSGEQNCRTYDEEAQVETVAGWIVGLHRSYEKERESAIVGSSFLMKLLGFQFETQRKTDSRFLTVILTSKDGERFEVPEANFVEMLETFADRSKGTMLDLLHAKNSPGG